MRGSVWQENAQAGANMNNIVLNDTFFVVLNVLTISGGVFNMNKATLIAKMAEKSELSKKQAEAALNAFTDTITEALKAGEKVQLMGFGTFEVKERAARTGRKPSTGETIEIPAKKTPSFKAGKGFKDEF